jgi:hypothetical protein
MHYPCLCPLSGLLCPDTDPNDPNDLRLDLIIRWAFEFFCITALLGPISFFEYYPCLYQFHLSQEFFLLTLIFSVNPKSIFFLYDQKNHLFFISKRSHFILRIVIFYQLSRNQPLMPHSTIIVIVFLEDHNHQQPNNCMSIAFQFPFHPHGF